MTAAAIVALLTGLVGLVSTILAYNLNPKRILQAKLDAIADMIKFWEEKKDEALANNDTELLNVAVDRLIGLRHDQADLLAK